jgi:hypothetical protein
MFPNHSRPGTKTPRRILAVIATISLAIATFLLGIPSSSASTESDTEKSILLIGITWTGDVQYPATGGGTKWSDLLSASAFCTGWFASTTGHIVTAGHCVDPQEGRTLILKQFLANNDAMNLLSDAETNWKVDGGSEGKALVREVKVVQPKAVTGAVITDATIAQVVDFKPLEEGDMALLHVAGLSSSTPALSVNESKAEIGAPLTAIGFPGSVGSVVDGTRIRPSFKTGTVSSNQAQSNGIEGTEINADISPGMSGGPTIDKDGHVLGINSFTVNGETRNFNFITNATDLRSFLKSNSVTVEAVTPTTSASPIASGGVIQAGGDQNSHNSDGSSLTPILITIGAVLLAAILGFLFWRSRQQKSPAYAGAPQVATTTCSDPTHNHPLGSKYCADCGQLIASTSTP